MKVLVPLDGSPLALTIAPAVRRLLEVAPDTEVHLLMVLDPRRAQGIAQHPVDDSPPTVATTRGPSISAPLPRIAESHGEALSRIHTEAEETLRGVANTEFPSAKTVIHATWSGKPADAICELANNLDIDLIAMATHGRSGISHLLAGSVTEGVIRTSGKPLLVVGPDRGL
jgi:nucleotide-binding universal stress UspA family protein